MAKKSTGSVDAYLAAQPEPVRAKLERVRAVLRRALPGAEEVISYQIPAYKLDGKVVIYFAGWKAHYAVYPIGALVAAELSETLLEYELSKGTIRFPLDRPVPARLIGRIAKLRAREVQEHTELRSAAKPSPARKKSSPKKKPARPRR